MKLFIHSTQEKLGDEPATVEELLRQNLLEMKDDMDFLSLPPEETCDDIDDFSEIEDLHNAKVSKFAHLFYLAFRLICIK